MYVGPRSKLALANTRSIYNNKCMSCETVLNND